jgi:hypothetical protein
MRARAHAASDHAERSTQIPIKLASPHHVAGADRLFEDLRTQPWRVAGVYALAGFAYALVTNISLFVATGLEFFPIRFLSLLIIFMWPVVVTIGVVAATTRAMKAVLVMAYFALLFGVVALAKARSPDLTWGQVPLLWGIYNIPDTILFLTFLARRVRGVGPLVLTVLFIALAGSDFALVIAGSSTSSLMFVVDVAMTLGLGGVQSFYAVIAVGFVAFMLFGWLALGWIKRRYQAKLISDESVTVDSLWALFAFTHSLGLVFEHVAWAVVPVAAFVAYKAAARLGFSALRRRRPPDATAPRLLLLRSFSIGSRSEQLFDALEKHWRRVGSIQLIAGVDLAKRSVEPHEFLDFITGKLSRRFIDGPEGLLRRLSERDTLPDRDLRFRVNDFFCYDDTWKMVLSSLVSESDAVLMDLRGFSNENSGCIFEIRQLAAMVPFERVLFIVDRGTDLTLLTRTLGEASSLEQNDAPTMLDTHASVFKLESMRWSELQRMLRRLANAAGHVPVPASTPLLPAGGPTSPDPGRDPSAAQI